MRLLIKNRQMLPQCGMGGGIPLGNTVSKKTILSLSDAQNVDALLPS